MLQFITTWNIAYRSQYNGYATESLLKNSKEHLPKY
jgi:hypothetical protein